MSQLAKIANVMDIIRDKARAGEFVILPHAVQRRQQRSISVADIVHVLVNGSPESKKDEYKQEYAAWNYAVRGKTIDQRVLRIAVSFDDNAMLVITVIGLGRRTT